MGRNTPRVSWPPGSPDDKPADWHLWWVNLNGKVYSKRHRTICSAITGIFLRICDKITTYACNFPAYVELLMSKAFYAFRLTEKNASFLEIICKISNNI